MTRILAAGESDTTPLTAPLFLGGGLLVFGAGIQPRFWDRIEGEIAGKRRRRGL